MKGFKTETFIADDVPGTTVDAPGFSAKKGNSTEFNWGGIPMGSIQAAQQCGADCLAVYCAIWQGARFRWMKTEDGFVPVTSALVGKWGVESRKRKATAIGKLEAAGLVEVRRQERRSPLCKAIPVIDR